MSELNKKAKSYIYEIIISNQTNISNYELLKTRINNNSFSDILEIDRSNTDIKLESVKKILLFLSTVSNEVYGLKFVIINNADFLNNIAQNALLKTIEDPPSDRYIFLLCNTTSSFLPTIISRAQLITFASENFGINNLDPVILNTISEKLISILQEGNITKLLEFAQYLTSSDKTNEIKMTEYFLCLFTDKYRDKYSTKQFNYSIEQNFSTYSIIRIIDYIEKNIIYLDSNINSVLFYESLLIYIMEEFNAENSRDQI